MPPEPNAVAAVVPIHARAAALILDAFLDYNGRFADITRRAQRHFERGDWRSAQLDAGVRLDLYDTCIRETLARLQGLLDDRMRSRALWSAMRDDYARRIEALLDRELTKTFFNTLARRCFLTRGVDPVIEFVALDDEPLAGLGAPATLRRYAADGDLEATCERVLAEPAFARAWADREGDARAIAAALAERAFEEATPLRALALLHTVFYRERRAYLVGRLVGDDAALPLVIALVGTPQGLRADAVLTNLNLVSLLFGYARNSFHADLPTVGDVVAFLHALMPHKPVGELYSVLGRRKQGKTERYRALFRHLRAHPAERFVRAPGARGMVMAVFTPPGHAVVIKMIRDRFAWPKEIARREVEAQYDRVVRYDRVGRLLDVQEFRDLRLPRRQFEPALLAELAAECADSLLVEDDDVIVRHCYLERRLQPLDLYVRAAPFAAARRAVLDYGQAIKDLARSNIFPGDLLLKNFGVSRIGRAIFYDYDELCRVEDCRFRRLPAAREGDETRPVEDWLSVRDNDVFPEQFVHFLGLPAALRDALLAGHPEIFDAAWWEALRARFVRGEPGDVPPYPAAARLPG